MSNILKQMEQSGLTLEEVQELTEVLEPVLRKVERQLDHEKRVEKLGNNLRKSMAEEGTIEIPVELGSKVQTLEKSYKLLQSANIKLVKFTKLING